MYKIVAVQYINTLPFIKAFQEDEYLSKHTSLKTAIPKDCALALLNQEADVVLLPIGSFDDFDHLYTVSQYGIASDGPVHTVGIFSHHPWEDVKTVQESNSSRSSNLLLKILNDNMWNSKLKITNSMESQTDAKLIIGDEAFEAHHQYAHYIDLAAEWKKMTGLPFVFASWMSCKKIDENFLTHLNKAFKKYTDDPQLQLISQGFGTRRSEISNYFQHHINYPLNDSMRQSVQLFYTLNGWTWNQD